MADEAVMPLGVYGSLLDTDVRRLVLGRCRARAAVLAGWHRVYVAGTVYPGIQPLEGAETGVLVLDALNHGAIARCDAFEGAEYERRLLPVRFEAGGSVGQAMFYVPTSATRLTERPWRYDRAWRARHGRAFLAMTKEAMRGHRKGRRQP